MLVIPTSNIKILRCPLELDNDNQINFASANDQYTYFNSLPKIEEFDYTYVRRDNNLRVQTNENLTYETLLTYNYVMYQNEGFSNKWFYAHITSYTWINSELTILTLEEDFFQSWQFDIVYGNSFIEREHVTDDTIGAHTIDEGLEKGDYIVNTSGNVGVGDCHAVVVTNYDVINKSTIGYNHSHIINSVNSGLYYYVAGEETSVTFIDWIIEACTKDPDLSPDMIQGIYMVPDSMTNYGQGQDYWSYASGTGGLQYAPYHVLDDIQGAITMQAISISKQTTLNGYTPKNNKLLTGEYNYLLFDNNGGNSQIYAYEYFTDQSGNCTLQTKGAIAPGCSIKLIPYRYKNVEVNYQETLNLVKLPVGSWSCDMYINWLTQNSINVGGMTLNVDDFNLGKNALSLGTNLAIGNVTGVVNNAIDIGHNLIEQKQHKRIPPQTYGNTNSGDVTYALGQATFTLYKMTIKQEYAKIIDDYFEHYGYKVNTFKTLSITGRPYWNYVKTTMCNLEGNIPSDAMQKLKEMFNHGVTIWHNPANFLNYSLNNH